MDQFFWRDNETTVSSLVLNMLKEKDVMYMFW